MQSELNTLIIVEWVIILGSIIALFCGAKLEEVIIFILPIALFWEVGIKIRLAYVLILLSLIRIVLYYSSSYLNNLLSSNSLFIYISLFLSYLIIVALYNTLFEIPSDTYDNPGEYGGAFLRAHGRPIGQIIVWVIRLSLFVIIPFYLRNQKIENLFRIIIYSFTLLALLGLIQLVVYTFTELDIFPLLQSNKLGRGSAVIEIGGFSMLRIKSIASEPRDLGVFLAFGISIILISQKLNYKFISYPRFYLTLFLITLFFTLSTGAFILLFVVISFILFISGTKRGALSVLAFYIALSLVVVFNIEFLSEVIQRRVLDRDLAGEDADETTLLFLSDQPFFLIFGTGIGNVHFLANKYVLLEHVHITEATFIPHTGGILFISEMGIVGTLFFLFIYFTVIRRVRKKASSVAKFLKYICMVILLFFMLRTGVIDYLFLTISCLFGYTIYSREKHTNYLLNDKKLT